MYVPKGGFAPPRVGTCVRYARDDGPRFKLPIEGGKGAKGVSSLWTERRRRRHRRNFLPSPLPLRAPLSFSPPFPPSLPPHPYPICAHPPPPFRSPRTQRVSLPISSPPRGRRDPGRTKERATHNYPDSEGQSLWKVSPQS